jgi:hypothetical protein
VINPHGLTGEKEESAKATVPCDDESDQNPYLCLESYLTGKPGAFSQINATISSNERSFDGTKDKDVVILTTKTGHSQK